MEVRLTDRYSEVGRAGHMGKRSAVVELFLGDMGSIQRELRPSTQREDQLTMETKLEQIAVKAVNQLPKSVVREIRTPRSVGAGGGRLPPARCSVKFPGPTRQTRTSRSTGNYTNSGRRNQTADRHGRAAPFQGGEHHSSAGREERRSFVNNDKIARPEMYSAMIKVRQRAITND